MGIITKFFVTLSVVALSACATPPDLFPITDEQRDFTYDFVVPEKSKKELFKSARNYFAISFGDSKHVSRVEDEEQGTIIGKALSDWKLYVGGGALTCYSRYNLVFLAKDGKARLQLSIIEGAIDPCIYYELPFKRTYPQIVTQFNDTAKALERALNGNSPINKLSDF